jgi:hypothetical protein
LYPGSPRVQSIQDSMQSIEATELVGQGPFRPSSSARWQSWDPYLWEPSLPKESCSPETALTPGLRWDLHLVSRVYQRTVHGGQHTGCRIKRSWTGSLRAFVFSQQAELRPRLLSLSLTRGESASREGSDPQVRVPSCIPCLSEKDIRESTPFTIVTNNIKYLGVTLRKWKICVITFKINFIYYPNVASPSSLHPLPNLEFFASSPLPIASERMPHLSAFPFPAASSLHD